MTRVPLDVPYTRMAVAARVAVGGLDVIVYGSILAWLKVTVDAPDIVGTSEDSFATFRRVLQEQADDVLSLRSHGVPVIWAGDFNQSVEGPTWGGSQERRELLRATLDALGLRAWNASASHAAEGMCAVDLLCGPPELEPREQGVIPAELDGVRLSDHAGYWVVV